MHESVTIKGISIQRKVLKDARELVERYER